MLKWKIIKRQELIELKEEIARLKADIETKKGEIKVLKDMIKEGEDKIDELKKNQAKVVKDLRDGYEKEILAEQEKLTAYISKQKKAQNLAVRKWMYGFPGETFNAK